MHPNGIADLALFYYKNKTIRDTGREIKIRFLNVTHPLVLSVLDK
jgi:hypothetical protein